MKLTMTEEQVYQSLQIIQYAVEREIISRLSQVRLDNEGDFLVALDHVLEPARRG